MNSEREIVKKLMESNDITAKEELDEGADSVYKLKKAFDDAGIRYTIRGKNQDSFIVSKSDLVKASKIRDELGVDVHVGALA